MADALPFKCLDCISRKHCKQYDPKTDKGFPPPDMSGEEAVEAWRNYRRALYKGGPKSG